MVRLRDAMLAGVTASMVLAYFGWLAGRVYEAHNPELRRSADYCEPVACIKPVPMPAGEIEYP